MQLRISFLQFLVRVGMFEDILRLLNVPETLHLFNNAYVCETENIHWIRGMFHFSLQHVLIYLLAELG